MIGLLSILFVVDFLLLISAAHHVATGEHRRPLRRSPDFTDERDDDIFAAVILLYLLAHVGGLWAVMTSLVRAAM